MARLVVESGPAEGRSCDLADTVVIGRDPACDLALEDTLVSRRHVRVRVTPSGFVVEDLGSTNGTRLNDQPVTVAQLKPGDKIRVGSSILMLDGVLADMDSTVTLAKMESNIEASVSAVKRPAAAEDATIEDLREQISLFCDVSEALGSVVGLDELLDRILAELFRVFEQAERGFVILAKSAGDPIEIRARRFRGVPDDEVTLSRTIIEHVISLREAVLTRDAAEDGRFSAAASVIRHGVRSMMCAPLVCAGEVLGAIYIDTTDRAQPFTRAELQTLVAIAAQAALAVSQAQLVEAHVDSQRLAAIGQTVAGLAHCVKNILNGMQGGSYILDRALAGGDIDRLQRGWGMVKRNSAFMSDLVLDMLSYAREREPVYEAVDPCAFLDGVRDLVNVRAGDGGVELTCDVEDSVDAVYMDQTAMKRCLLNLAVNAVEACDQETGRVRLGCRTGPDPRTVRFTVSDNGCGISKDALEKLFTIFFSTKGSKGTGLGLAVSRKIVEEHGGTINVTSTPGEGTEFIIDLPRRSPELMTFAGTG